MEVTIKKASMLDGPAISAVHREAFSRQRNSEKWVMATLSAEPRFFCFVIEVNGELTGYIFWAQKSGIRPEVVLELDQIAVLSKHQGMGYAERLINQSVIMLKDELLVTQQKVKAFMVSTRVDNLAQRLYSKVLGVEVVAQIDDLYSAAEVIMISKK